MGPLGLMALLVGCGPGGADAPTPASTTIVAMRSATVNVNPAEGTVSRAPLDGSRVDTLFVGDQPTRVARVGDELWVTLRGERAIAIVVDRDGRLVLDDHIEAGVEPFGIVSDARGRRVFVASSLTDEVLVFDAATRTLEARHRVFDEPRWLALHPSGDRLYVGSARNGRVTSLDLRSGETERLELPETRRFTLEGDASLTPRVTGDLGVSPDGDTLAVPILYVDVQSPVVSGDGETEPVPTEPPIGEGYGSGGGGVSRLNPTLATFELDRRGDVRGPGEAVFIATTLASSQPFSDFDFDDSSLFDQIRSFPSSVTAMGEVWVVTMEGSDALLLVHGKESDGDVAIGLDVVPGAPEQVFTDPFSGGFALRSVIAVATRGAGPRGVAVLDDRLVVHDFLDRSVEGMDREPLEQMIGRVQKTGFLDREFAPHSFGLTPVETSSFDVSTALGERLFHSARDARMAGAGAGVSCSTCHFDGRTDGLTWNVDGHERQTPSLAGEVSATAPVTWTNEVASVADEAMLTTSQRMGGEGLTPIEAGALQDYIDQTPLPDPPRAASDDAQVRRGEALFFEETVGCASCHSGEAFTDNQRHQVQRIAVQTPTLRGVVASAPYLHDGSLPTLESVVQFARGGTMGDTSALSEDDVQALVAFLESL